MTTFDAQRDFMPAGRDRANRGLEDLGLAFAIGALMTLLIEVFYLDEVGAFTPGPQPQPVRH